MISPANRLNAFSEYYFSTKLREIRELQLAGRPIINLGIGNPDLPPDSTVIDSLVMEAKKKDAHGYQPYRGLDVLQQAIRGFYNKRYKTDISLLEVLPLMGSKEGITHASMAYLNPGDLVLLADLSYPTYSSVTTMAGAQPVYYPLVAADHWAPDWKYLDRLDTSRVKLMWINYPHMPTGTKADHQLLQRLVHYAIDRNILICHDNPYSFIGNDNPISIFSISGADRVALEFSSLSKTFNMAGWRVGWVAGAAELVQPVLQVKSNMDSGMYKAVQVAAAKALQLEDGWFNQLNETYGKRRLIAQKFLTKLKCTFDQHQAGMFVWAKVPVGSGEAFADMLLDKYDIFVAPGFIFGRSGGNDYIRVSLCLEESKLEEVLTRI